MTDQPPAVTMADLAAHGWSRTPLGGGWLAPNGSHIATEAQALEEVSRVRAYASQRWRRSVPKEEA